MFLFHFQNLNKMLTDEDRKLIEKETGVKQEEVHEADQREVRVPNYLNEIQLLNFLYGY